MSLCVSVCLYVSPICYIREIKTDNTSRRSGGLASCWFENGVWSSRYNDNSNRRTSRKTKTKWEAIELSPSNELLCSRCDYHHYRYRRPGGYPASPFRHHRKYHHRHNHHENPPLAEHDWHYLTIRGWQLDQPARAATAVVVAERWRLLHTPPHTCARAGFNRHPRARYI